MSSSDLEDLEKEILKWLESRPEGWIWFKGTEKFSKAQTIKKFKEDTSFRKSVLSLAIKKAIDDFRR